jgi:hypothetical protein
MDFASMGDIVEVGLFEANCSVNRALRILDSLPINAETAARRAEFVRTLACVGTKLIDVAVRSESPVTRRAAMQLADRIYARSFDVHVPECSA